jgi:purine-binding chemotaxis protein CheW
MQQNYYFIFKLNSDIYGIDSSYVEEVLSLPELILLPELDCDIVGIFDLRGKMLPVLDLSKSLGYPKTDYHLSDSVIVIRSPQFRIGIIINGFSDMRSISLSEIVKSATHEVESFPEPLPDSSAEIIAGMVISENKIWILNDLENWIKTAQILAALDSFNQQNYHSNNGSQTLDGSTLGEEKTITFCPTATDEERAVFRNRAKSLKVSFQVQEQRELQAIVVFALGEYLWGIDSGSVREFVDIKTIIPVPCCPIHIIGNTNLRGEVLTLVDIRKLLNLPILEISTPCKVMIVQFGDEGAVVGIMVDRIHDAMFLLNLQDVVSAATTLPKIERAYLRGVVPYGDNNQQFVGILDLPKLLLKGGLVVDELV